MSVSLIYKTFQLVIFMPQVLMAEDWISNQQISSYPPQHVSSATGAWCIYPYDFEILKIFCSGWMRFEAILVCQAAADVITLFERLCRRGVALQGRQESGLLLWYFAWHYFYHPSEPTNVKTCLFFDMSLMVSSPWYRIKNSISS